MKLFLAVWILMVSAIQAEEMEVRKYHLSEVEFEMVSRSLEHEELREGEVLVEKPGFKSRFFEGEGKWYDCTKRVGSILKHEEFSGVALMDHKRGLMVMKAENWDQENFTQMVLRELRVQIRTTVAVYELPEVVVGMQSVGFVGVPKGGRLRSELAVAGMIGVKQLAKSPGGEVLLEIESQMDADRSIVEQRFTVSGLIDGMSYKLRTGSTMAFGVPWGYELGSLNGETSLVLVVTSELVKMDGALVDEMFEREKGGVFLKERRLQGMRSLEFPDDRGEFRVYPAPPGINYWTTNGVAVGDDPDPFAVDEEPTAEMKRRRLPIYEGKHPELNGVGLVYDMRDVFRENGISFREGDFAVFNQWNHRVYAKLSPVNHDLTHGMLLMDSIEFGRMIRVDLEKVGEGGGILKKIGVLVLPGQKGEVGLGPDLKAIVEAQIDATGDLIEAAIVLIESGGDLENPSIGTGVVLRNGVTVVVQEIVGSEKKSWKVTANIVEINEVVDHYLKGVVR